MFGNKMQHKEILDKLNAIEKQNREYFHSLSSDIASLESQMEQLKDFLKSLNIPNVVETMQYFNATTNYIADLIENITIEETTEHEPNDNGHC